MGDPLDSVNRRASIPEEHQASYSGRWRTDSQAPIGTLEERVVVLERAARAVSRRLWALLGAVAIPLGTMLIWALDQRETVGAERARIQIMERDLDRAQVEIDRLRYAVYRWRRDDAPALPGKDSR